MNRFAVVFRILSFAAVATIFTQCSSEPAPSIEAKDGSEMLLIPAGEFTMGGRKEDLDGFEKQGYHNYPSEGPFHKVSNISFYMDKYEITNAQYAQFLSYIEKTGDHSIAGK